jgi:hypothetical protein
MYIDANTSKVCNYECIAPGARWKRFLLAASTARRREAAAQGSVLARKWRAFQCVTARKPATR